MASIAGEGAPEAVVYTKEPFREVAAPRKIKSIRFGLMSSQEVVRSSEFHVFERNLYEMPQRKPLQNGVLDRRLVRARPGALRPDCDAPGYRV